MHLGDRIFCTYIDLALLHEIQVDVVTRVRQPCRADVCRGRRLRRDDLVVMWTKPRRHDGMDDETYQRSPDQISVSMILEWMASGATRADILEKHPYLTEGATEADLLRRVFAKNRLMVTHDSDFGTLTILGGKPSSGSNICGQGTLPHNSRSKRLRRCWKPIRRCRRHFYWLPNELAPP